MYMLDTDICVYVLGARSEALEAAPLRNTPARSAFPRSATRSSGTASSTPFTRTATGRDLSISSRGWTFGRSGPEAGRHYGDIREQLTRRGTPIGSNDLLIAAHARSMEATLVTNNVKEFSRVPDLQVVNWA